MICRLCRLRTLVGLLGPRLPADTVPLASRLVRRFVSHHRASPEGRAEGSLQRRGRGTPGLPHSLGAVTNTQRKQAFEESQFESLVASVDPGRGDEALPRWRNAFAYCGDSDVAASTMSRGQQCGALAYIGLVRWTSQLTEDERRRIYRCLQQCHVARTSHGNKGIPNFLGRAAWALLKKGADGSEEVSKLEGWARGEASLRDSISWRTVTAFLARRALQNQPGAHFRGIINGDFGFKLHPGSFRLSQGDLAPPGVQVVLDSWESVEREWAINMITFYELTQFWKTHISTGRFKAKIDDWAASGLLRRKSSALWRALTTPQIPIDLSTPDDHGVERPTLSAELIAEFLRVFVRMGMHAEEASLLAFVHRKRLPFANCLVDARIQALVDLKRPNVIRNEISRLKQEVSISSLTLDTQARAIALLLESEGTANYALDMLHSQLGSEKALTVDCYAILVTASLACNMNQEAIALIEHAQKHLSGDSLGPVANRVLRHFSSKTHADPQRMKECLRLLAEYKVEPSERGMVYQMRAKLAQGDRRGAQEIMAQITNPQEKRPALGILVAHLSAFSTPTDVALADKLIEDFRKEGMKPPMQMYAAVIAAYCRLAIAEMSDKIWPYGNLCPSLRRASVLLFEMLSAKITVSRLTYNELLSTHLARRTPQGTRQALEIFTLLERSRNTDAHSLQTLGSSWRILLLGLQAGGEHEILRDKLAEIQRVGVMAKDTRKLVKILLNEQLQRSS